MNFFDWQQRGDRFLITKIFLRLFGVVWLFNMGSLVIQVTRLFTADGLIPVSEYAARIHQNYLSFFDRLLACPSIFCFYHPDWFIITLAWVGLLLAIALIAGWHSRICLVLLFLIYHAFVSAGQELYSFQWDSLMLEATFLAIWLPGSGRFFRDFKVGANPVISWLFLWLLFRLYVESGVAKLFWGPESWSTLEGMSHYYETAPIPTWVGYYAHFLPEGWHRFETGATLILEILLPCLFFGSTWMRRTAFVLFTGLQLNILLTANYGVFNYTSLVVQLFLLKDADLRWAASRIPLLDEIVDLPERMKLKPKRHLLVVAVIVVAFSLIEFTLFAGGRGVHKTMLADIHRYTGITRIASRYHLFGPIDPIRYELVIEGSVHGRQWKAYPFPYKIVALTQRPQFVAPYHPRVDFRLWFERYPVRFGEEVSKPYPEVSAHPKVLTGYLKRLVKQLLREHEKAMVHFTENPFPQKPPAEIRITYYHYNMVQGKTLNGEKQYWTRQKVGTVYFDLSLGKGGQNAVVQGRTTGGS